MGDALDLLPGTLDLLILKTLARGPMHGGARATQTVWLLVRRTLLQLAIGLTLGLGGALALGRLIESS
jgi:hypothetical protein